MSEKLTNHQQRAIKKTLANKSRREEIKEAKRNRPPKHRDGSRPPRRRDWHDGDEEYFTSEKIRRLEKIKPPDRPQPVAEPEPAPAPGVAGTVIEVRSGDSLVMCRGRTVRALLPAAERVSGGGLRSPLAVGDRVAFEPVEAGLVRIARVLPRRSGLLRAVYDPSRRDPNAQGQVLAANIDQVAVVCSPNEPPFRPGLIDRYLAAASRDGLPAAIFLNKTDLGVPDEVDDALRGYAALGIATVRTSAATGAGLDAAKAQIAGKVSLFTGHSGVGKSSLLNAIEPGLALRVGEVTRAAAGQGKGTHTTSSARLIPLSSPETFVVDSPGIRAFGVRGIGARELASHFPDIAELAADCAYRDCLHRAEPECSVRAAQHLDPFLRGRYRSYRTMLAEVGG